MENQIVDIEFEDGISEIAQIAQDTVDGYEVRLLEYNRGGRYIFGERSTSFQRNPCLVFTIRLT